MNTIEQKRKAFKKALKDTSYDVGVTIGSYVGALKAENETLRSANEDLLKENRTLKNFKNIDVEHPSNKFF